jgi:hypothetical protein
MSAQRFGGPAAKACFLAHYAQESVTAKACFLAHYAQESVTAKACCLAHYAQESVWSQRLSHACTHLSYDSKYAIKAANGSVKQS